MPDRDPLIDWHIIGGSVNDNSRRRIADSLGLREGGWKLFIERRIRPTLQWGARRILLANPFGTLGYEAMQFDQALHAREMGLNYLVDDFAAAWSKLITEQQAAGDPIQVLAYLGCLEPKWDPNLTGAWKRVLQRVLDAVTPILEGKLHGIIFDAVAGDSETCLGHAVATLLESELFGLVTWGEAWPHPDSPWRRRGFAILDSTYLRWRDDPKIRAVLAPRNQISGECIHLIESGSPDRAKQILREGDTAAIAVNHLIKLGVSREQLLAA